MYALMCVNPETTPEEDYFPATKKYVENNEKMSTLVPVPKYWLIFSYISSEYYQLDLKRDETELKIKSDHKFNNKDK